MFNPSAAYIISVDEANNHLSFDVIIIYYNSQLYQQMYCFHQSGLKPPVFNF